MAKRSCFQIHRELWAWIRSRSIGETKARRAFRREHPLTGPEPLESRSLLASLYLDGWQKWEFPNGGFPFATGHSPPPPHTGSTVGHSFSASSWDSFYFGLSQYTQPGAFKLTEGQINVAIRPSAGDSYGDPVYVRMSVSASAFNSYHGPPGDGGERRRLEASASGPHELFRISESGDFTSASASASYTYRARIGDVFGGNLPFSFLLSGDGYYLATTGGSLSIYWTLVSGPDLTADRIEYDAATGDVQIEFGSTGPDYTLGATSAVYWSSSELLSGKIGQPVWQGTYNRANSNAQGPITVSHDKLQDPPQGAKYLVLAVDEGNQFREHNEANNAKALKLADVDLSIKESDFQWRSVEDNGGFTFVYTVSAEPGISFPDTTIKFYWSKGPTEEQIIVYELVHTFHINSSSLPESGKSRKAPGEHVVTVLHNGPDRDFSLNAGFRSPPAINHTDPATGNALRAPYLVAIVDQADGSNPKGTVEERSETNNLAAVAVYPLVVNVVTHGYRPPDEPQEAFVAPFKQLAKALDNIPADDSILDGRVRSRVVQWDSTTHFHVGLLELVGAKLSSACAQLTATDCLPTLTSLGWQIVAAILLAKAKSRVGPADNLLQNSAHTEAWTISNTTGYLEERGKGIQRVHLVGHSRGAGVNAILANLLIEKGYRKIDFTALDGYASDWPNDGGLLSKIDLSQSLSSLQGERQNWIAQYGIEFDPDVLTRLLAFQEGKPIDIEAAISFLQNSSSLRAPQRLDFGLNAEIPGSFHTTITRKYIDSGSFRLNYIGRNADKGNSTTGLGPSSQTLYSAREAASTVSSMNSNGFLQYGFFDGSIEQLGALDTYFQLHTVPQPTGIYYLDTLLASSTSLVSEFWGTAVGVSVINHNGNYMLRGSGGASFEQLISFPSRAKSFEFDLIAVNPAAQNKVELVDLTAQKTLGTFVLPVGNASQHVSLPVPLSYLGKSARITIILTGELFIDNLDISVAPNHAPTVIQDAFTLPNLRAGRPLITNRGISLHQLTGGMSDANANDKRGIAIVATNTVHGRLEFSENSGVSWQPVVVTPNTAFLAAGWTQNRLRFVPNSGYSGTVADVFSFRAWDMTTGLQGIGSILATGGETAFSSAVKTASISVTVNPWHNLQRPLDVAGAGGAADGVVVAGDALAIINYINAFGAGAVPESAPLGPPYYDTSDDEFVSAGDALAVINHINAFGSGLPGPSGEGEASVSEPQSITPAALSARATSGAQQPTADLLALLALDIATQLKRKRN